MKNELKKAIWINAPIEEVFASFTDQDAMMEWHGKHVETNPVEGGMYRVVFENGTEINGSFVEVHPPTRLVYRASYGDVSSTVEINLVSVDGGTQVYLVQRFEADQDTSSFNEGWDYFLGLLKTHKES